MLKVRDNNIGKAMLKKVALQLVMFHKIKPKNDLLNWDQGDNKSKNYIF